MGGGHAQWRARHGRLHSARPDGRHARQLQATLPEHRWQRPISPRVLWADDLTRERPSCVQNGAGWNCSCPTGAAPAPAIPAGGGVHAGFRICFEAVDPPQPGVVRVVSTGRTSFVDRPCEERGEGTAGEAAATVSVVVALSSGLAAPPGVALTVRGDLDVVSPMRLLPNALPTPQKLDADWMPNGWLARVGGAANTAEPQPNNRARHAHRSPRRNGPNIGRV